MLPLPGDTEARLAWLAALRILDSSSHLKWTSMLPKGAWSKMNQEGKAQKDGEAESRPPVLETKPKMQMPDVPEAEEGEGHH